MTFFNRLTVDRVLLAGIILLLQWHGITFWYEATGISGVLFSVVMETAALYLWYKRHAVAVAALCSLLVILGPLYAVSAPVLTTMQQAERSDKMTASYELEIGIDAKAAKGGTGNITRLKAVEKARADAKKTLDEYRKTLDEAPDTIGWLGWAKIAVQALGLICLQWTQIIIVRGFHPVEGRDVVKEIIISVAAGKFDDNHSLKAIQDSFGVGLEEIRKAFGWLLNNGYMEKREGKLVLVKQGRIRLNEISL